MTKTDAQLKEDLEAELDWDPKVNAAQVRVTVEKGGVSLREARWRVVKRAGPVHGRSANGRAVRAGMEDRTASRYPPHVFTVRSPKPRKAATLADLREVWDAKQVELIAGEIVEKASPGFFHGNTQGAVFSILWTRFGGGGGGAAKPTWWFASEVDVRFDERDVFRPDIAGWRRDRLPAPPAERPVRARPDWVCEVLSSSDKRRDQVLKLRVYHRHGVPHYWLLDPEEKTLTVYRWQADGYVNALTATAGERVRAEPFDALEFPLGALFGEEPQAPKRKPRGPKR